MNGRPTNTTDLESLLSCLFNDESRGRGATFRPLKTDIFIAPYAKCGTTWLQQIAHGLRTRGSMDFEEITSVTPWPEIAYDMGWDLDAPQVAQPRLFKSHLSYHDIQKGGRYIVAFRHPYDATVSLYRFFEGWFFETGTISREDFVRWRYPSDKMGEQGYWYHLTSWWGRRTNENILLLCFEDMKEDLPGTVNLIANHMGIDLDDELHEIVVRQASRNFMLAHRNQFDDHLLRARSETFCGLPPGSESAKITTGPGDDSRYQLAAELKQELDDIWREQVEAKFGFAGYDELRRAVGHLHADQA